MENFSAQGVQDITSTTNEQTWPDAVQLSDGSYVVVYSSDYVTNNQYHIYAKRYSSTGEYDSVIGEIQISATAANGLDTNFMRPRVAVRSDSGFVVAWCDRTKVYTRRYNSSFVAQTSETVIDSDHGDYLAGEEAVWYSRYHCEIGVFSDDSYIVSYSDLSTTNHSVAYQIFDSTDTQTTAETTALEDNGGSGRDMMNHQMCVSPTTFMIVAQRGNVTDHSVYAYTADRNAANVSTHDSGFTGRAILTTSSPGGQNRMPSCAYGNDEWLVVSYDNIDNDRIRLFRVSADLTTVTEQDASNEIAGDTNPEEFPVIAVLQNGDLIISYLDDPDGSGTERNVALHYINYDEAGPAATKYTRDSASQTALTSTHNERYHLSIATGEQDFMVLWATKEATGVWDAELELYIGPSCFAAGTLIPTVDGERPIEEIKAGDYVLSEPGVAVEVIELIRQSYMLTDLTRPVDLEAGSLGQGLPRRRLTVSPGHSLEVGGRMTTAETLSHRFPRVRVSRRFSGPVIDYYHLRLVGRRSISVAGLRSESYHPPKK